MHLLDVKFFVAVSAALLLRASSYISVDTTLNKPPQQHSGGMMRDEFSLFHSGTFIVK